MADPVWPKVGPGVVNDEDLPQPAYGVFRQCNPTGAPETALLAPSTPTLW